MNLANLVVLYIGKYTLWNLDYSSVWFLWTRCFPEQGRKTLNCLFVSDLHGSRTRYQKLWEQIKINRPEAVFLGGDLLPHAFAPQKYKSGIAENFIGDFLSGGFADSRDSLGPAYPQVFLILGNDDPRSNEPDILKGQEDGLWLYAHNRCLPLGPQKVFGYSHVPPSPFLLKDWEKYDVSRYVDPGCISPEEGSRTTPSSEHEIRYSTIASDLQELTGSSKLQKDIFLFHSPPYKTKLDRADLDGKLVDHVPLDVHVGSIAIKRFIESRQPLITLHGHIHESPRLTGSWQERIGTTHAFSAAHDGPELALVLFDSQDPTKADRRIL